MNEAGMLKPALIGGVLLGILSVVPGIHLVNCFCCAWVIGGGIVAAYLYVKSSAEAVTLGRGAGLGLIAGAVGAVVDTLFSIPLNFLMTRLGGDAMDQVRKMIERVSDLPPEARDAMGRIFSGSPATNLFLVLAAGLIKLVVYPVMAMLGGTLGVALFEKRKPGPPLPPPPLPGDPWAPPPPPPPSETPNL